MNKSPHVAFFVNPSYGHIVPTLGIAMELIRRNYHVSYAVQESFAPLIRHIGARAVIFHPIETRIDVLRYTYREDGYHNFDSNDTKLLDYFEDLRRARTADAFRQLESQYSDARPDVIVHDNGLDTVGTDFAKLWSIPRVKHDPHPISPSASDQFAAEDLIIVSIPRFLNESPAVFDKRFQFIGFVPEGRELLYTPWTREAGNRFILACPTTGMLPQNKFVNLIVESFAGFPRQVVLSTGASLDPLTMLDPSLIARISGRVRINNSSANIEVLQDACLFVGQGGPSSTMEALYCGVPPLLLPPSQIHDLFAVRVAAMGLGIRMDWASTRPSDIRDAAMSLMNDQVTLRRVGEAREAMRRDNGAVMAADLLGQLL